MAGVFLLTFLLAVPVFANPLQNITVSLHEEEAPLSSVLGQIESQSGYSILVRNNNIDTDERVSISVKDEELDKVLAMLFEKKNVKYEVAGRQITIYSPSNNKGEANRVSPQPQQDKNSVSGTLTDESGEPIIGGNITVVGSTLGTISDMDGNFVLTGIKNGDVLQFSYMGYTSQSVTYNGQSALAIALAEDNQVLNEVVVVGYGTQKKVNLTGAISAIDSEQLAMRPVGQLSSSLQGMAPGVTITTNTGQPGLDKGSIRIRGIGSLSTSTDSNVDKFSPLVLVDGVESDINDVDANDIVSISILKDAAAASIYGVRAANGVILITTQRGETGKAKVTYSNYFGWQSAARLPKYVGAKDFMQLANRMGENSDRGSYSYYTQEQIEQYNNPNRNMDLYPDTNWIDEILTGSGFQEEHSVSLTGGTQAVKYAFSTNYFDQNGLITNMDYDRLTVRLNTDITISDNVDFNIDLSGRFSNRTAPQTMGSGEDSEWAQFGAAYNTNPLYAVHYSDGTYPIVRGEHNVIRLQKEGGLNKYKSYLYTANFRANWKVYSDFTLAGAASFKMEDDYTSLHTKALDYYTDYPDNTQTSTIGVNSIKKTSNKYFYGNYQALANYNKKIDRHNVGVLLGISYLQERTDNLMGYRTGIPTSTLSQINAGSADGQQTEGYALEYGLFSYFARVNYSFDDKYLLEANIRRDASSRFSDGQRWGTFPSFSAGWRLSEEDFMQDIEWMDNLKIRGSWGELGNDKIGYYPYQSTYEFKNYPFGGTLNQTASMTAYPNSKLTWETTRMWDIGFDFTTLGNRLNFSFDYYEKVTRDVLMQLSIPSTVGLSAPYQNAGKIGNKGWEVAISYNDKIGRDFQYSVGFNISDVRNKVLDIQGTDRISTDNNYVSTGLIVGKPINSYYGYNVLGLYQTQADLDKYPAISSAVGLGDLIYEKISDSESFSTDDMVYLGSDIPRYTYGIDLGASYKGFDFSALLQGVGKVSLNTLPIEKAPTSTDGNFREIHWESWTPENPDASFPRLVTSNQNYYSSSFWVKSGAYLRLKNVQLGYTLPKSLLDKTFINRVRLYVSASNLFTITGLPSDIDPESPTAGRYYPQVKTFTFGLNLDF